MNRRDFISASVTMPLAPWTLATPPGELSERPIYRILSLEEAEDEGVDTFFQRRGDYVVVQVRWQDIKKGWQILDVDYARNGEDGPRFLRSIDVFHAKADAFRNEKYGAWCVAFDEKSGIDLLHELWKRAELGGRGA